jgi:prepilin peptidase CpaA
LNLVASAPVWLLILFAIALLAAAIEDALRFRIANLTCLAVLVGAGVAAFLHGPSWALWQNAVVFAVLLTLGTLAFSAGWLGGGDVKLFAATGLWFDLRSGLALATLIFLAGGVVAICYVLSRPLRRRLAGRSKYGQVPYGIAIAVGALAMIALNATALQHHQRPLPPIRIAPANS